MEEPGKIVREVVHVHDALGRGSFSAVSRVLLTFVGGRLIGEPRADHCGSSLRCAVDSHHPAPDTQQVSSTALFRCKEHTEWKSPRSKAFDKALAVSESRPPVQGMNAARHRNLAPNVCESRRDTK